MKPFNYYGLFFSLSIFYFCLFVYRRQSWGWLTVTEAQSILGVGWEDVARTGDGGRRLRLHTFHRQEAKTANREGGEAVNSQSPALEVGYIS